MNIAGCDEEKLNKAVLKRLDDCYRQAKIEPKKSDNWLKMLDTIKTEGMRVIVMK